MYYKYKRSDIISIVAADECSERRSSGFYRSRGKAEFILELLEDIGTVPEDVRTRILKEKNTDILSQWHRAAARAESAEQFAADYLGFEEK